MIATKMFTSVFFHIYITFIHSKPVTPGTPKTKITFGPQDEGPRPLQEATSPRPRPAAVTPLVDLASIGPLKQTFKGIEYNMWNHIF